MFTAIIISVIVIFAIAMIMDLPGEVLTVGLAASIFTWFVTMVWDIFGSFMGWWTVIY